MNVNRQSMKVPLPSRGLKTTMPGLFMDKRYSPGMDNVRMYAGEVLNRPGSSYLPSGGQTLDNIPLGGGLLQTTADALYTVLATKTKWYYYNTGTPTWSDITGAAVFNGTDGNLWDFAVVHGKLVGSNAHNTDKCYEWTGTGNIAQLSNSHAAKYVEAFADRIFLHNTIESGTTYNNRVRWCASGSVSHNVWDPATDATAGFLDLMDTPGGITGAKSMFGQHYVFKRDYIHRITETGLTTPSFYPQTVVDGVGCAEGRTIVEIDGMLYFLGRENVYRWDTAGPPQAIGTDIRNELFDQLNRDSIRTTFAFHHELFNEYWLMIPSAGDSWPSVAYIFNYITGSWAKAMYTGTCHVPFQTVDTAPQIKDLTDPIDTYIIPFDSSLSGADVLHPVIGKEDKQPVQVDDTKISDADGTTPTLTFDTADSMLGEEASHDIGTVSRVILTVRGVSSGSIAVELSTDGGKAWTNLGSQSMVNDNSRQFLFYPCRVSGQQARLRLTTTDYLAFQGYSFELFQRAEAR